MAVALPGMVALGVGGAIVGDTATATAVGWVADAIVWVADAETLIKITYDFADKEKVEIYTKEIDELGVEFELEEELKAIVESGLQSIGFGSGENSLESSRTKVDTSGDSSEREEEVESLASTVERIMKNLNLKITQLRRSLEESRSNNEHLQSLTEKHAQDIVENMLYIKELEDRERMLAQNVERLMVKIKEAEAEVARWREACELEIQSGKHEIEQRDTVVAILTQELEKRKTDLDISNRKLNKKEELAAAAQATAEKSLQLADSTAARLRELVEELSKQLEEAESRYRNRYKLRHICWPWKTLKLSTATMNNRVKNVKRMLSK
ncbi:hypothetical protein FEM48_Zijuj03G0159500 [Ziziphus jujuba var. spinosa]|uniref:Uncharacterized protein n=1 Tax=Ziziphus jujuba var. spinosa TaxID=714518 RepID=A0A978VR89_ZIZJJ|nr:hypothetical protein FEM48_Zijuj03G0159500 [Ziziphus jujuba var. spinosa]